MCDSKQQSVIQQLNARKGRLIVMCSKGDAASVSLGGACRVIEVPQVEDCLQPVVNIVPLQVLQNSSINIIIIILFLRAYKDQNFELFFGYLFASVAGVSPYRFERF